MKNNKSVNDYLDKFKEYLILDNESHFQLKVERWEPSVNINSLIPEEFISHPAFEFFISLSGIPVSNKKDLLKYTSQLPEGQVPSLDIVILITIKKFKL